MQVLADSAYGTGEVLAALAAAGHTAVIKPWPLRPAVPGGFTLDDFTVDEAAGTATCPHGRHPADQPHPGGHLRRGLPRLPAARPLHHRRRGRSLHLHPHDALQRAHRARAADPDFQADLPPAPADGRTLHRLADPRQPPSALPRQSPRTTPGCTSASPRSTSAACSPSGSTGTDGHWALAS